MLTEQLPRDEVLVGWSVLGGCIGTKGLPRVVTQCIYPGVENIHADGLSREGVTVEGRYFTQWTKEVVATPGSGRRGVVRLGEPQVGLFAPRACAELRLFCAQAKAR